MQITYIKTVLAVVMIFSPLFSGASLTVPSPAHKTITEAIASVKSGDTIWVLEGVYKGSIKLSSGVVLISKLLLKAVIDGEGSENAVIMGNRSTLTGFEIKNSRIGVYSEGIDNSITRCFIHDNQQSGIICVGHLPLIVDNIIVENGGSGIQGWDVRSTIATVNHNTIAYNGNHGLAIGGNSDIVVENNILAFNEKLGYKVDAIVKLKLIRNNFYLNSEIIPSLPSDNFSFDPMFVASSSKNYMLLKDSKCRNMASDNENIGARIIY